MKKDIALRKGVSSAIWIPTIWVAITASRPLSTWFAFGGGDETLEGSPLDRLGFFVLIVAAWYTVSRRKINWSTFIPQNWPVFLFYGFLLISVIWANSPFVSFKRWFKETGNIIVLLVVLTEADPLQAFRAVFVRCAYVLIPLSVIFLRYFPDLGRRYNSHSGEMEAIGVTFQKNSLGGMVLVCSLIVIWDWFEKLWHGTASRGRFDRIIPAGILVLAMYLLYQCDSKTSIACIALGSGILASTRLPFLRRRIGALGGCALAGIIAFVVLDAVLGIKEWIIQSLGRDMTFTGRTDVWAALLNLNTDPVLGTGFLSFWDDKYYQSKLPDWVAYSAHNGYVEIYIAGGYVGILMLSIMLIATGFRINSSLKWDGDYAVVRFAVFAITLIANFFESNFACMTPLGFLFLLVAIGHVDLRVPPHAKFGPLAETPVQQPVGIETGEPVAS